MPLHQLSSSAVLKNKQNARQMDPQSLNNNSPVKPSNIHQSKCSPQKRSAIAQINQLKIKLSDREFELKKLEEDCIVKLALMQKQLTKQKNEKKLVIKQWKQKLQEDRHYYEAKILMVEQQGKAKAQHARNQAAMAAKQQQDKQKESLKESHELLIKSLKDQLALKQQSFIKQKAQLLSNHQSQINSLQLKYKSQIQQIHSSHEGQMIQIKQTHLSEIQFYQQLEEQKSKEQHVVSKILSDKIRGLEEEIRTFKTHISELNKEIETKNKQISFEKRQKDSFRLDKICLERKLARIQPKLKQICQKDLQTAKSQYEQLLSQQVTQFAKKLSTLTTLHQKSIQSYKLQISQLQQRSKQVSLLYTSMKSNDQDLKKIQTLQMKLIRKQMQLEKQRDDTKMCKLQLSNMDQIFHKMFEDAKVKSLKTRKHRLPSLMSVGQNRSTMDCYSGVGIAQPLKDPKKFSIREVNYQSISKGKQNSDFGLYQ